MSNNSNSSYIFNLFKSPIIKLQSDELIFIYMNFTYFELFSVTTNFEFNSIKRNLKFGKLELGG